jgi:tRNA A-37 threonylcarbamoyl transferase component Bud32
MIAERGVFTLHLPDRTGAAAEVSCESALRVVSGKRSSHLARWNERDVFVKLFFHKRRARLHWQREKSGIETLVGRSLQTPALLYAGWIPAQRSYVLITEALTGSRTLADAWAREPDAGGRLELLSTVVTALAQQHQAGVVQTDLHPGNFLLVDRQVYSIDASTIKAHKRALPRDASLANLGLLLAQFEPSFDHHANKLLMTYASSRRWQTSDDDAWSLRAHIDEARVKRKQQVMKKIFRECSAFARRADRKIILVYDKHYASEGFQDLYRNPDSVFAEGHGRYLKRGNTSTVVRTTVDGTEVVVKRYNIKGPWHGIRRILRRTRASISWKNANLMGFYGIATPRPIAFVEKRTGPAKRTSYFISEYIQGINGREFFGDATIPDSDKEAMAERIVAALMTLERYRMRHGDLKATNIIIRDATPYWVDLDGMREYKTTLLFRPAFERDIVRLHRNWEDRSDIRQLFQQALQRACTKRSARPPVLMR